MFRKLGLSLVFIAVVMVSTLAQVSSTLRLSTSIFLGTGNHNWFQLNTAYGISEKIGTSGLGAFHANSSLVINLYNGGLGTAMGSTRRNSFQLDFVFIPSITCGIDGTTGRSTPLYQFNAMTENGLENTYENAITYSQNLVFNGGLARNRNQRVGSVNIKYRDFTALTIYNDVIYFLGDNDDRWWTGGGMLSLYIDRDTNLTFGTEVFTGQPVFMGIPRASYPIDPGRFMYFRNSEQRRYNNGQTFFRLESKNMLPFRYKGIVNSTGRIHSFSQDVIHGYGRWTPLFNYSNAAISFQAGNSVIN